MALPHSGLNNQEIGNLFDNSLSEYKPSSDTIPENE